MNISTIKCNSTSVKSQNNYNFNKKVSFCGGQTLGKNLVKNPKDAKLGCLFWGALIATPFIMLIGAVVSLCSKMSKSSTLNDIYLDLHSSMNYYRNRTSFDEAKEKMTNLLDKHSKNYDYSAFVKGTLEFLSNNFENSEAFTESIFNRDYFVRIIYDVAKAAIYYDKEKTNTKVLNERMERTRKVMEKFDKNNS